MAVSVESEPGGLNDRGAWRVSEEHVGGQGVCKSEPNSTGLNVLTLDSSSIEANVTVDSLPRASSL